MFKPNREFQSGLKTEERRRSRQDDRLKLRRADRENRLQTKRRALQNRMRNFNDNNNNNNNNNSNNNQSSPNKQQSLLRKKEMLQQLPQYVQGCFTDHPAAQFECTQRIRKLLSLEREPPISAVIQSGVVPRLIQFLKFDRMPRLQFEAAWALTNIASGTAENTAEVIRRGAVPLFVKLLSSPSDEVKEQAIWALGNIAGDSPECRNLVLSHNALDNLLPLCRPYSPQEINDMQLYSNNHNNNNNNNQRGGNNNSNVSVHLSLLRNATWTLSNFCRGKPQPETKYIKLALQALQNMLHIPDDEILCDACWAFSYLSDTDSNADEMRVKAIVHSGALERLIELFNYDSDHVKHPALRSVGNIVCGPDSITQDVINLGLLPNLLNLLNSNKTAIKKEACWTISNITAGPDQQIEQVIGAKLIPPLIRILQQDIFEVQKEAMWAISNATSGGNDQQIIYLVHNDIIPVMCNFLKSNNAKAILVALEGIENILNVGRNDPQNRFATMVEECGGLDSLETLQSNDKIPDNIFDKAQEIITTFWGNQNSNNTPFQPNSNQNQNQNQNQNNFQSNPFNNNQNQNQNQNNQNGNQFGFGMNSNQNQWNPNNQNNQSNWNNFNPNQNQSQNSNNGGYNF